MTLEVALRELASKAEVQSDHIRSEQDTKRVLVVPFIRDVLGFDTEDARQVLSEYAADHRNKNLDKVDYALFANPDMEDEQRKPVLVVEAKKVGVPLSAGAHDQLSSYFYATSSAPIGIYTNGVQYHFFSDLDSQNKMDKKPFLSIDLRQLNPDSIADLVALVNRGFNSVQLRGSAREIQQKARIASELHRLLIEVPDELVRLLMRRVGEEGRSKKTLLEFRSYVEAAMRNFSTGDQQSPMPIAAEPPPPELPPVGWVGISVVQPSQTNRPRGLKLPDGTELVVRNWRHVILGLFEWLYQSDRLSLSHLPLYSERGALLANQDGRDMRDSKKANTAPIFVELNLSGAAIGKLLEHIIDKYELDPASIQIHLPN